MVRDRVGDDFVLRSWVQLLLWKYFGFSPFGYRNEVKKVPLISRRAQNGPGWESEVGSGKRELSGPFPCKALIPAHLA